MLLRTFSKTHSLAGLRVGYALGPPSFKAAVDAVRQPFSVNALAQAAAIEALKYDDVIGEQIRTSIAERTRVEEAVQALGPETTDSAGELLLDLAGRRVSKPKTTSSTTSPRPGSWVRKATCSAAPAGSVSPTGPPRKTTVSSPHSGSAGCCLDAAHAT